MHYAPGFASDERSVRNAKALPVRATLLDHAKEKVA
jgi:hypothetical protein